ncbi:hypothetical protein [Limnoglobus roseus]|uniref:Uncharacterized protein n=1 Tax=Limnoglobus roseus TaxID=2598579 RepID=A0A5C1ABD3_9BACT|nr:hypothetical protein [Limnoglobus roseus]QEL14444.1 hypothetical protein PX52LOC_01332 [Limnoglobus roseus]
MFSDDVETRLRIVESNYGREYGWYVERDGRRLAALTEPISSDMFWVRYRVEPVSSSADVINALFEDDYWCSPKYVFRNQQFPHHVIEGMGPVDSDRRHVMMRFLYIVPPFGRWERVRYFWRLWRAGR